MSEQATAAHEIVSDIKRVASDLGRIPSKFEYLAQGKFTEWQMRKHFGGWAPALIAAGLQPDKPAKKRRVDLADLFGKDIRDTICIPSVTQVAKPSAAFQDTLVIGDTHFPFVNQGALSKLYEFCDRMKPKRIIQVGDLFDSFSNGKFPRSRNIYNPHQEIELAYEMAKTMWAMVKKLSPGAECYQILGNHDVRPIKRIIEAYPEGEIFFSIDKFYQFDGVTTVMDTREVLDLGHFVAIHGHKTKLGDHRDELHRNVVCGHSHRGGVSYRVIGNKTMWEMNAGYLGNAESKALSYTSLKVTNWTLGFGWIDCDGPRFIAL